MTIPYQVPTMSSGIDLDLSKNEGSAWALEDFPGVEELARLSNRYPNTAGLRAAIADRHEVDQGQILVTAGGDDALSRCFLANVGDSVVATTPTFEMIRLYAAQSRCSLTEVAWWDGPLPIDDLVRVANDSRMAVVVSPNNPTGQVITADDLRSLAKATTRVVLDCAYADFADEDLTPLALELGNVVVVRTMSKAFGLAGLRVGYLIGASTSIDEISSFGSPYPVSGVSAHVAEAALRSEDDARNGFVSEVKRERTELKGLIEELGDTAMESQANFVFAHSRNRDWLVDAAGALGVGIRSFPGRAELDSSVRISVPGRRDEFARLTSVLRTVRAPDCFLFDLDGVIADVSHSYRAAIIATAAHFGANVTHTEISRAKAAGNANDDWELTARLCRNSGIEVAVDEVVDRFEALYQGTSQEPGLKSFERPLVDTEHLEGWSERAPLGIVTGRPRKDAIEVLDKFGFTGLFATVVTRDDGPLKPSPAPVAIALNNLGTHHGWMIGDTVDDLIAARRAGVLPIGVRGPGEDPEHASNTLSRAAVVLDSTLQLEEILDATQI